MYLRTSILPLAILLFAPAIPAKDTLSADDIAKIRLVHKQYEDTWLNGDANGVRSLFTEDCILLPPHAAKPEIGLQGLNEFWFPPHAPATEIIKLVVTIQGIGGDGQLAYTWGTDEVAWTTAQGNKKIASSHKGIFLNVLQKQPNGDWKISHHMWDDAVLPH
jgi:uncharacterized protein (TIGR02246 family)